jgi:hypothetical protein
MPESKQTSQIAERRILSRALRGDMGARSLRFACLHPKLAKIRSFAVVQVDSHGNHLAEDVGQGLRDQGWLAVERQPP